MLRIPESHLNFQLSKKEQDDHTVGLPNPRHIVCKFCKNILIPEGCATKVFKNVSILDKPTKPFANPDHLLIGGHDKEPHA